MVWYIFLLFKRYYTFIIREMSPNVVYIGKSNNENNVTTEDVSAIATVQIGYY